MNTHTYRRINQGLPTTSIFNPWTEAEVETPLATGWAGGATTELKLEYLYGPRPPITYHFSIEFLGREFSYSGLGTVSFGGSVALASVTLIDKIMACCRN